MKALRVAAATLALGTSIAVVPGLASANKRHPGNDAKPTSKAPPHTTKYVFRGIVVAAPGAGSQSLLVQVRSGNPAALKLLGSTEWVNESFGLTASTQMFSWNTAGTSATPATSANVLAGDPVAVTVWGPAKTTVAQLLTNNPATRVDDVLNSSKPAGRIFIFVGQVVASDSVGQTITMNVTGGNWRAMFALNGQSTTQTFHWNTNTVFLNHGAKGQRATTPATMNIGDTVVLRVFSVDYNNQFSALVASPAWRVSNHEPKRLVQQEIRMHNEHKL